MIPSDKMLLLKVAAQNFRGMGIALEAAVDRDDFLAVHRIYVDMHLALANTLQRGLGISRETFLESCRERVAALALSANAEHIQHGVILPAYRAEERS